MKLTQSVPNPLCRKCQQPLKAEDQRKASKKFWTACKTCRDRAAAAERVRKTAKRANEDETHEAKKRQRSLGTAVGKDRTHLAGLGKVEKYAPFLKTLKPILSRSSMDLSTRRRYPARHPLSSSSSSGEGDDESEDHHSDTGAAVQQQSHGPTTQDCSVCTETVLVKDFAILSSCTHPADVYHTGFLEWLDQQLSSASCTQIGCPTSDCSSLVTHDDVRIHASPAVFTRFDDLYMRAFLSTDPDFRYCLNPSCSSGQGHPKIAMTISSAAARAASACVPLMNLLSPSMSPRHAQHTPSVSSKNAQSTKPRRTQLV
ncbi:hypothetical protein ACN47E_004495 [Coniothyrium glycines]